LDNDADGDNLFDIDEAGIRVSDNDTDDDGQTDRDEGDNGLEDRNGIEDANDDYSDINGFAYESGQFELVDTDNDLQGNPANAVPRATDFDYRDDNDDRTDTDGDNISDEIDDDDDGDGIPDAVEGDDPLTDDPDGDQIPNSLDLDSDGDQIPDNIEVQSTEDYIPPSGDDDNENGLDDAYDDTEGGTAIGLAPVNTDNDPNPDYLDTDSDGDGIDDQDESGIPVGVVPTYEDVNGGAYDDVSDEFTLEDTDGDVDPDGKNAEPSLNKDFDYRDLPDNDGDLVPDFDDLDDDNDGILDTVEGENPNTDDPDGDNIPNSLDLDSDGDAIPDNIEAQLTASYVAPNKPAAFSNNGIYLAYGNGFSAVDLVDTNNDGNPDYLDLDSDGDGVSDKIESGFDNVLTLVEADPKNGLNDGVEDIFDYTDVNGVLYMGGVLNRFFLADSNNNVGADGSGANPAANIDFDYREVLLDTDGDQVSDIDDLDDDNDGILDTVEGEDDPDGDGIPNRLDLDSDGDAIPDNIEAQLTASYVAPNEPAAFSNGIYLAYGNGFSAVDLVDTNNDGNPDYLDLDSDGDSISDKIESGFSTQLTNQDISKNGLDDSVDSTSNYTDVNGVLYFGGVINRFFLIDSNGNAGDDGSGADPVNNIDFDYREVPLDTDGDQVPNDEDLDDDNDGIPDTVEDDSADGDNDGIKNSLDLDSDGDAIPDNIEAQSSNSYVKPSGFYARGIDTAYGAAGILNPVDTDVDGTPDYLDENSDDDNKTDAEESGLNLSLTIGDNGIDTGVLSNGGFDDVNGIAYNDQTGTFMLTNTDSSTDFDFRDRKLLMEVIVTDVVFDDSVTQNNCPEVDETITYTYTVTNIGDVSIASVASNLMPMGQNQPILQQGSDTGQLGILEPNESWTYKAAYAITTIDISNKKVSINASADGVDAENQLVAVQATSDTNEYEFTTLNGFSSQCFESGINLQLTNVTFNDEDNNDGCPQEGETITYSFKVVNSGAVPVSEIELLDGKLGNAESNTTIGSGDETETISLNYEIKQEDIDLGKVESTTNVNAEDTSGGLLSRLLETMVSFSDTSLGFRNNCLEPLISLVKQGQIVDENEDGCPDVGETVLYTYTVTNNGNITLRDVVIVDNDSSIVVQESLVSLAPGEQKSVTASLVIDQSHINAEEVVGFARVTADYGPVANPLQITEDSTDGLGVMDTVVSLICLSDLSVVKETRNENPTLGSQIIFTITVENQVDGVGVSDILVTDDLDSAFKYIRHQVLREGTNQTIVDVNAPIIGGGSIDWRIPQLPGGGVVVLQVTVELLDATQGTIDNTAIILESEGVSHVDTNPDNDESTVTLEPSCIEIYNLVSPGEDNKNDNFSIRCLNKYPNYRISFYNRYGSQLKKVNSANQVSSFNTSTFSSGIDYPEDVEAIWAGGNVPSGTYYYILDLGDGEETMTGWIQLE
jgi:gliding motility-associated-like protein/uncharacterized repeat protein (TIGR01451 family)